MKVVDHLIVEFVQLALVLAVEQAVKKLAAQLFVLQIVADRLFADHLVVELFDRVVFRAEFRTVQFVRDFELLVDSSNRIRI